MPTGNATIVALHCSGSTGRQWQPLQTVMGGRFNVLAPDLLESGAALRWSGDGPFRLTDEARTIIDTIDATDGPIHLVGHSYGGCVISGIAEVMPDATDSLVFLDAFIPDNGDSTFDLVQPAVQEVIRGALAGGEITVPVRDAAAFRVNEKDRAWVDSLATPQPIATMTEKLTLSGARERMPKKAYIRASGYPNVSFEKAHARAKADPTWRTYEVPCGHDVMIDEPERLTEILLEVG